MTRFPGPWARLGDNLNAMAQQATVLIIADVGDSERAALEAACANAGFAPSVEPSAEAATGKLTAKRYDALVVHLGTPGAALACMRARGKLLRTRIPVITLRVRGRPLGATPDGGRLAVNGQ